MEVCLTERSERLKRLTAPVSLSEDFGLVKTSPITLGSMSRVRGALNYFLWNSLCSFFPERSFILSEDMLRDYTDDILKLPNITPNGLILPKKQNQLAYNLVHAEVAKAFDAMGFGRAIRRIQYPVNIRLQSGRPDPEQDHRQRSSVKPHTDIWAGDPGSGIIVFLAVLGSVKSSGIHFMQPRTFPTDWVRTLEDFDEGAAIAANSTPLCELGENRWFMVDSFVIHKTVKNGSGYRISIDFRFMSHDRVASDFDEDHLREPYFIPYPQWLRYGHESLYVTGEPLASYDERERAPYTRGYPVKLKNIDLD